MLIVARHIVQARAKDPEYGNVLTLPLGSASLNRRHYAARFSWAASQACSNCIGLT